MSRKSTHAFEVVDAQSSIIRQILPLSVNREAIGSLPRARTTTCRSELDAEVERPVSTRMKLENDDNEL